MSVKIRLQRVGRKKQPSFRIVVTESRNARNGEVIETIGNYCPYILDQPLVLDLEKVDQWLKKGAIPTDAVLRLVRKVQKGNKATPESTGKKAKAGKPAPPQAVEAVPEPVAVEPVPEPTDTQSIS